MPLPCAGGGADAEGQGAILGRCGAVAERRIYNPGKEIRYGRNHEDSSHDRDREDGF